MTNTNATALQSAMNAVLSLNAKIEGVSINLLQTMFDSEVTFDKTWLELFCRSDKKTDMLNAVLFEQVPSYKDTWDLAKEKITEKDGAKAMRLKEVKLEAQKKLKTAENTLRNVINALIFLRVNNVMEVQVQRQKLRGKTAEENGDLVWSPFFSMSDLTKYGKDKAQELGWLEVKASNPKVPGSSVKETAERAAETGGYFPNAVQELSKALMTLIRSKNINEFTDDEISSIRELEAVIITTSYAGEDGKVDHKTLSEVYEGEKALVVKSKKKAEVVEASDDEDEAEAA